MCVVTINVYISQRRKVKMCVVTINVYISQRRKLIMNTMLIGSNEMRHIFKPSTSSRKLSIHKHVYNRFWTRIPCMHGSRLFPVGLFSKYNSLVKHAIESDFHLNECLKEAKKRCNDRLQGRKSIFFLRFRNKPTSLFYFLQCILLS